MVIFYSFSVLIEINPISTCYFMNRRSFVLSSALGLAGIIESRAASTFKDKSSCAEYFDLFVHAVDAYSYPQVLAFEDTSLDQLISGQSASLRKSGYVVCSPELFFCDHDRTVFIPYQLMIGRKEVDRAVLFFSKDMTGKWQFMKTYSGFHLEVFAGLIQELKPFTATGELMNYLLPALHKRGYPSDVFYTRNAQIRFQVRINEGKTAIEYQILENREITMTTRRVTSRLLSDITV